MLCYHPAAPTPIVSLAPKAVRFTMITEQERRKREEVEKEEAEESKKHDTPSKGKKPDNITCTTSRPLGRHGGHRHRR
jgi:hypothetical protein